MGDEDVPASSAREKDSPRTRSMKNRQRLESYLLSGIAEGSFAGGKLPPERELVRRFGIPRYTVRKTIAGVSARFPMLRTAGRGTFLAGAEPIATGTLDNCSPADIIQARLAVEPGMTELVVLHATRHDFEEMERCLAAATEINEGREFKRAMYRLHLAIAAATHNKLLGHIFELITAAREAEGWNLLQNSICATAEGRRRYLAENREIVKALRARDGARARQLLYDHLARVHATLVSRPQVN